MYSATFKNGLKHGIPIALGYLVVSFTYGMMATMGGLPPYEAILISMTSLTSAGQFAGTNIMIQSGTYLEILISMIIINSRYMLMSTSLSQKITEHMPLWKKLILSFGITDETFTVASVEVEEVTFEYFLGLMTLPYFGWALGTLIGSLMDNILSPAMENAASIALYCMFIALFIPPTKHKRSIRFVVLLTIALSSFLFYSPLFSAITPAYKIIIAAVVSSLIAAKKYPHEMEVDA